MNHDEVRFNFHFCSLLICPPEIFSLPSVSCVIQPNNQAKIAAKIMYAGLSKSRSLSGSHHSGPQFSTPQGTRIWQPSTCLAQGNDASSLRLLVSSCPHRRAGKRPLGKIPSQTSLLLLLLLLLLRILRRSGLLLSLCIMLDDILPSTLDMASQKVPQLPRPAQDGAACRASQSESKRRPRGSG